MLSFNKNLLFVFLFLSVAVIAQEKTDAWKEKIKNVSGDVSEIIIKTDKGEVKLTGEDAEEVFELLKSDYLFSFDGEELEMSSDGGDSDEKVFVVKIDDGCVGMKKYGRHSKGSKKMLWVTAGNDEEETEKNIEVEIINGKKKITVTTEKDGEKAVKVYEGEKAEEFSESEEGENVSVYESGRHCRGRHHKGHKVIIIEEDDDEATGEKEDK